jgi:hypothetical protein
MTKKTSKRTSAKNKRLLKLYRITLDEQNLIEAYQQKTKYAILLGGHMGVDHDHYNGLIRGRLDFRINKALGYIEGVSRENAPKILRTLADYLEYPPATTVLGKPRYGLIGKAQVKKKMVYGGPSGKA